MEKKIAQWLEKGLINDDTATKLISDVKKDKAARHKTKITITLYTIAAILLGIGVITFISANDWILDFLNRNKFLKIILMFLASTTSFYYGYKLSIQTKNFPKLGQSLIILSSLLIGGTYALIGQIYNLNADKSSLMFLWLISILPIAYLYKIRTINNISMIIATLGIIFFYNELSIDEHGTWAIFIPILCGITFYTLGNLPIIRNNYYKFALDYKIFGAIPIYLTFLMLGLFVANTYVLKSPFYIVPPLILILLNIYNYMFSKEKDELLKIETIALIVLSFSLFTVLMLSKMNIFLTMLLSNIAIIGMVTFGFNYGYKFERERIIGVTNWMLTIYLLINYSRWGWSFFDKTLFFIIGGLFFLSLGLFLEKKRKKIKKGDK